MQGADTVLHAHMNDEILRPYAGIIRIRFLGMISATVTRAPLQIYVWRGKYTEKFLLIASLYLNLWIYNTVWLLYTCDDINMKTKDFAFWSISIAGLWMTHN